MEPLVITHKEVVTCRSEPVPRWIADNNVETALCVYFRELQHPVERRVLLEVILCNIVYDSAEVCKDIVV
jgi:hypothetical protein